MKRTVPQGWSDDHMRLPVVRERLKEARHWKFTSAKKVAAAMAGLEFAPKEATVAKHENGENNFTLDELLNYAEFYGANPLWILTGGGPKQRSDIGNPDDDKQIARRLSWEALQTMLKPQIPAEYEDSSSSVGGKSYLIESTLPDASMNKLVPASYTITIDCADRTLINGRVYLFFHSGNPVLRRFQQEGNNSVLIADSTDNYPLIMIGKKVPPVIGRLVAARKDF